MVSIQGNYVTHQQPCNTNTIPYNTMQCHGMQCMSARRHFFKNQSDIWSYTNSWLFGRKNYSFAIYPLNKLRLCTEWFPCLFNIFHKWHVEQNSIIIYLIFLSWCKFYIWKRLQLNFTDSARRSDRAVGNQGWACRNVRNPFSKCKKSFFEK